MEMTMIRPNITEQLEALIDGSSLLDVLTGLSLICSEKADHIRDNWQDTTTARTWRKASNEIEVTVRRIDRLGI
jgi:hypothetical protein